MYNLTRVEAAALTLADNRLAQEEPRRSSARTKADLVKATRDFLADPEVSEGEVVTSVNRVIDLGLVTFINGGDEVIVTGRGVNVARRYQQQQKAVLDAMKLRGWG